MFKSIFLVFMVQSMGIDWLLGVYFILLSSIKKIIFAPVKLRAYLVSSSSTICGDIPCPCPPLLFLIVGMPLVRTF